MRIRHGFVSNSSSSSFICTKFNTKGYFGADLVAGVFGVGYCFDDYHKEFDSLTEEFHQEYDESEEQHCVVRSFLFMKEDQTLAQFMTETFNMLQKEISGEELKCSKLRILIAGSVEN